MSFVKDIFVHSLGMPCELCNKSDAIIKAGFQDDPRFLCDACAYFELELIFIEDFGLADFSKYYIKKFLK